MEHKYKFSVIIPHYDKSISDDIFCEGIQCLLNQKFTDFEVLIYHDGPLSRPLPQIYKKLPNHRVFVTEHRENNWGHGNRDRGIKQAKGEYIIHFNPDNILYDNALYEINKVINLPYSEYPCLLYNKKTRRTYGFYNGSNKNLPKDVSFFATNNIIVFPIYMVGYVRFGLPSIAGSRNKKLINHKHIFTGDPVIRFNIDCMQLVMKTSLWLKYGGWYDKTPESDGIMYPKFSMEYGVRYCDKILGEHR